jgi:hypothetical protein
MFREGRMRSIQLDAQSRADGRRCSRDLADAKAQTMEEPQRRVTAEANTADELDSFHHLQPSCLRPICSRGNGGFKLIRVAAERHICTNEQITQGRSSKYAAESPPVH